MKKISADIRQYLKSPSPATHEAAPLQDLGQSCRPTRTSGNSERDDACTSQSSALAENQEDKGTDDLGTLESGSMQPRLVSFPKTQDGKQPRFFSSKHYETYPWLEYSVSRDNIFCFVCRKFSISSDVRDQCEQFITSDFNKWKKLTEALNSHVSSRNHKKCF
ncbi:hypothetical protein PR048_000133 [Dryococelus australis]|uniref:TTF-type domain-containing protein n=1 Tax=Dryococelus australis TaxID=614101 RepID=A0ABQ9IDY4_9NEOP|nr:hypothetical protein PR048_000133 [Dryococelus australis]